MYMLNLIYKNVNVNFTKEICFHKLFLNCIKVSYIFNINFYIMFVLLSNIFILCQIN